MIWMKMWPWQRYYRAPLEVKSVQQLGHLGPIPKSACVEELIISVDQACYAH